MGTGERQYRLHRERSLVADPKVRELYEGIVSELNQNLARFEQFKKVILVDEEFSAATGTLTHTMKVRRRGIEDRYKGQDREDLPRGGNYARHRSQVPCREPVEFFITMDASWTHS